MYIYCVYVCKYQYTVLAASQMWLLARILPLLIGDCVDEDDKHWNLYLQLMLIVDLLFCPKTSHDHAAYLAALINDHHAEFCQLYPGKNIIPKMHFMVHMPKFMIRYSFQTVSVDKLILITL